jgi:hypothetical protein
MSSCSDFEWPCFASTPQGAVRAIYVFRSMLVFLVPPAIVCATVAPDVFYVRTNECDVVAYDYLSQTSNTLIEALIGTLVLICLYGCE